MYKSLKLALLFHVSVVVHNVFNHIVKLPMCCTYRTSCNKYGVPSCIWYYKTDISFLLVELPSTRFFFLEGEGVKLSGVLNDVVILGSVSCRKHTNM